MSRILQLVKPLHKQNSITTEDFLAFLNSINAKIENGTLYVDTFSIISEDRISFLTKEEIVLQSGRSKNNNGYINSVHINPDLDNKNNPIRKKPHIPFSDLRFRAKPRRPINNHKQCRCCHE